MSFADIVNNFKAGDYVDVHTFPTGEYIGSVVGVTSTTIDIESEQGPEITLQTKDIVTIQKISRKDTSVSFGVLLGTPSALNLYGAITIHQFRLELMGLGGGVEGRVGYLFTDWKNFQQGLMLGLGTFNLIVTTTVTFNGSSSSSTSSYSWNYLSAGCY